MTLLRCPACETLWVSLPFEPCASFAYHARWPYSLSDWERLHRRDEGKTIADWHQTVVCEMGPQMTGKDAEAIGGHRQRSRGREPYNNHVPFTPPDLPALLREA